VTPVFSIFRRFTVNPPFLIVFWFFLPLSCLLTPAFGAAAEIRIDAQAVSAGQPVRVPIVVDGADDLAGVKIVLQYDPGQLAYRDTARAEAAGHMMHVVNDKQPGTLIIVMAGATGIQAENLALFTLTFEVAAGAAKGTKIVLRITESQLMSAQLKDIAHTVAAESLVVEAGAPK
jgi:hypothetical protein